MKMRILAGITALVVVGAGVFGVINRQTYTDITNEKNIHFLNTDFLPACSK